MTELVDHTPITFEPRLLLRSSDKQSQIIRVTAVDPTYVRLGRNWRRIEGMEDLMVTDAAIADAEKGSVKICTAQQKYLQDWDGEIPILKMPDFLSIDVEYEQNSIVLVDFDVNVSYGWFYDVNLSTSILDVISPTIKHWRSTKHHRFAVEKGRHQFRLRMKAHAPGLGSLVTRFQPKFTYNIVGTIAKSGKIVNPSLLELKGNWMLPARNLPAVKRDNRPPAADRKETRPTSWTAAQKTPLKMSIVMFWRMNPEK